MTELQVKAAQLAEDKRHNLATEKLTHDLNAAQAQHLSRSDEYTAEHYGRADTASLVSANAAAMNAKTAENKYLMDYDIEYGWTGSYGYPEGMPLSAQKKSMELEIMAQDPTSKLPAAQRAAEKAEKENALLQAEIINKDVASATSMMNSALGNVFGKGGLIKILDYFE